MLQSYICVFVFKNMNMSSDASKIRKIGDGTTMDWNGGRCSVHEIIKRFQQVPDMHSGWRRIRSGNNEATSLDGHTKCSQNPRVHSQGDAMC